MRVRTQAANKQNISEHCLPTASAYTATKVCSHFINMEETSFAQLDVKQWSFATDQDPGPYPERIGSCSSIYLALLFLHRCPANEGHAGSADPSMMSEEHQSRHNSP